VALGIVYDTWRVKAACKGPESYLFYPPSLPERREERDERERAAKAICATCSVRRACLDHAVRIREQHGIWGGLTESERRPLLDEAAAS